MSDYKDLIARISDKSGLCRNETATDIADLLDEASAALLSLLAERDEARDFRRRADAAMRSALGEELYSMGHPAGVVVHLRESYAQVERLWKQESVERDAAQYEAAAATKLRDWWHDEYNHAIRERNALYEQRDEARESLHYANGCCDLAMKHRDMAEAEAKHLREALERIATVEFGAECGVGCDQLARAALSNSDTGAKELLQNRSAIDSASLKKASDVDEIENGKNE